MMNFVYFLQVMLIALKVMGEINTHWVIVLTPLWFSFLIKIVPPFVIPLGTSRKRKLHGPGKFIVMALKRMRDYGATIQVGGKIVTGKEGFGFKVTHKVVYPERRPLVALDHEYSVEAPPLFSTKERAEEAMEKTVQAFERTFETTAIMVGLKAGCVDELKKTQRTLGEEFR